MDEDLRDLERRAAGDPSLRQALARARARAGLLDVAACVALVGEARARLATARERWADAMVAGLASFLGGAFRDHPGLAGVEVGWRLIERGVEPWVIELRVRPSDEPKRANYFADEAGAEAFHRDLLRFAALLPSQHEFRGARRIEREGEHVRVVDDEARGWRGRPDDREAVASREVPLRQVEDLSAPLAARRAAFDAGARVPVGRGDVAGALAIADGADRDLADETAAFLADGEAAWTSLLPALFAEHADLEVAALLGSTPGYNDDWYDEHRLEVHVERRELEWLVDEARQAGLPLHALADLEPRRGLPPGAGAEQVRGALEAFEPWLRLRRGACYAATLQRDGASGVARFGPGARLA